MRLRFLVFMPALIFFAGCAALVSQKSTVETEVAEVFEKEGDSYEDYQARIDTVVRRAEKIQDGTTVYEDLRLLGLSPEAKNVSHYRGAKVLFYLLGTTNPQIQLSAPQDVSKYLEEYSHYLVLEYHLHNFKKTRDTFYLSAKDAENKGSDLDLIVILRDGAVFKHYFTGTRHTEKKITESSAGGGLIAALKDAKDVLEVFLFFYLLQDMARR